MDTIAKVRSKMSALQLPALLVSQIDNVGWLTGFTGSSANVVVSPDAGVFVTDSRYTLQAKEQVSDLKVESYASPVELADFVATQIKSMGIDRVGFEAAHVTFEQYEKLKSKLNGIALVPAPDLFADLRLVKTDEEIATMRQACRLADQCFDHALKFIQPGVSEYDIGLEIEFFFRRQGAELAFAPIVVSGERSARPHGRASEKKLELGDFVTMDFGAKVEGYCSDITRTVVVQHASDRHRHVYGCVLAAQLAALDAMRPGVPAKQVDAVARDLLAKDDLAQYFGHGLGHGLGRNVHDGGRMGPTSTAVLEPGQVWTVEPGVYIPDFGGVRIEDDVVVTDDGIEILTKSPKELLILPKG